MNIKKVIKISFILMASITFIIAIINTVVIYQIKENNITKQLINDLVSMQEKMNELLKDATVVSSIDELDLKKEKFIIYELEFEKIRMMFKLKNNVDFVDYFISDIHENKEISSRLKELFESEKHIEETFDTIYELEKNKISLNNKFYIDYPIENNLRKRLI